MHPADNRNAAVMEVHQLTGPSAQLMTEIRAGLEAAANPDDASAMQRYMKSKMPFYGVRMPVMRSLVRATARSHPLCSEAEWRSTVLGLWNTATYREQRYAAIELAGLSSYREFRHTGLLPTCRHMIETGAWWDHVDAITSGIVAPILLGCRDETTPTIKQWSTDPNLWVRRSSIICQLHAKADTDLNLLEVVIRANLTDSEYGAEFFIRKAVGWALRQHARLDPVWVAAFVDDLGDSLSPLSRHEALKHIGNHNRS